MYMYLWSVIPHQPSSIARFKQIHNQAGRCSVLLRLYAHVLYYSVSWAHLSDSECSSISEGYRSSLSWSLFASSYHKTLLFSMLAHSLFRVHKRSWPTRAGAQNRGSIYERLDSRRLTCIRSCAHYVNLFLMNACFLFSQPLRLSMRAGYTCHSLMENHVIHFRDNRQR